MSTVSTITPMSMPLVARRTRAFFAPVDRVTSTPTIFDPAQSGSWNCSAPLAPWIDMGWVESFTRGAETVIAGVSTGMPATVRLQTRQSIAATVSFRFTTWNKLTMALASGSEHMNVLAAAVSAAPIGSGAKAHPPVLLLASSTATELYLAQAMTPAPHAGSLVVVDVDYAAQVGFVGSAVSGAYVQNSAAVGGDADYIRRVSFNVARVSSVASDGCLRLASPLLAGTPTGSMKLQQLAGFVDREGGSFFQEWSALFLYEGVQGEKLFFHYPRLQICTGSAETESPLGASLLVLQTTAKFRALPVIDPNDGQQVVCYRSFLPAPATYI